MQLAHNLAPLVAAVAVAGSGATPADPPRADATNPVTSWNAVARDVLPVDPGLLADSRAFAVMHAAIHDAVNGVERRYDPYTADLSSPGASVAAAVAAAAYDVLVALSPDQRAVVDMAYAGALSAMPDGPAKDAGVALGRHAARATLARRTDDGLAAATEPVYVPTGEPGDYDFTPPFDQPPDGPLALYPGWGRLAPFAIELAEHRLSGPDRLRSLRYARDFAFVKRIGSLESPTRTAEQTEIAFFWFEFSPIGWNRIASIVAEQQGADVWRTARILALVNFALADGYIAGFDAKYHFRFWRPYTAIREAESDGNRLTRADAAWLPLLSTSPFFIPPVPDYPSTHTVLGAAAAEVLTRSFGPRVRFATTSTSWPGVTRTFDSFTAAAVENGLSRVYGGIHFLRAVRDGYRQGRGIGRSVGRLLAPAPR